MFFWGSDSWWFSKKGDLMWVEVVVEALRCFASSGAKSSSTGTASRSTAIGWRTGRLPIGVSKMNLEWHWYTLYSTVSITNLWPIVIIHYYSRWRSMKAGPLRTLHLGQRVYGSAAGQERRCGPAAAAGGAAVAAEGPGGVGQGQIPVEMLGDVEMIQVNTPPKTSIANIYGLESFFFFLNSIKVFLFIYDDIVNGPNWLEVSRIITYLRWDKSCLFRIFYVAHIICHWYMCNTCHSAGCPCELLVSHVRNCEIWHADLPLQFDQNS